MNVIKIKSRIGKCVSVAYILNAFRVLSTSNVRVVLIAIDKNVLKTIFFNSSSCILLRLKCAFPSRHPNNTKSCQILEWKYDFFYAYFSCLTGFQFAVLSMLLLRPLRRDCRSQFLEFKGAYHIPAVSIYTSRGYFKNDVPISIPWRD